MAIVVAVVAQLSVFALVIVACTGQVGEPRGDRVSAVPEPPVIDPSAPQRDDELPTRDEVFAVAADLLGQMVNAATGGQPFAFSPQASEAPCTSLAPSGRATKLARMAVEVELPVGTSRAVLVDLINGYAPPLELAADSDEFRSELIVPSYGELELSTQLRDDAIIFERGLRPDADVLRITVENGCFLPPIE
ncbi:hypothetical protein [Plantibacter sp. T3]|uniref:hypothetical protein n=1 Tax=Plantibacter sp. T3 TaxID=2653161 RepID=UPI0012F44CF4|nr:hypothetical protein [Plantibacter sp. T3]VXB10048.1 conserved exported hypothetical protein [Plantibacter sp. T3]